MNYNNSFNQNTYSNNQYDNFNYNENLSSIENKTGNVEMDDMASNNIENSNGKDLLASIDDPTNLNKNYNSSSITGNPNNPSNNNHQWDNLIDTGNVKPAYMQGSFDPTGLNDENIDYDTSCNGNINNNI